MQNYTRPNNLVVLPEYHVLSIHDIYTDAFVDNARWFDMCVRFLPLQRYEVKV